MKRTLMLLLGGIFALALFSCKIDDAENIKDPYTVRHFEQNTDFTEYTLIKTESLTGTRGTTTVATAMSYIGFTAKVFEQKPISSDGTTIIDIYYDRNEYTVIFNANNGTDNTQIQTFYYGIAEKLKDDVFSNPGYAFLGWATSKTDSLVYYNQADFLINVQNPSDITLYAVWSRIVIVTADTAESIDLSNITDECTIKVIGNISQDTLVILSNRIRNAGVLISLDLSEATGVTGISQIDFSPIFADCSLNLLALPEVLEIIGYRAFFHCAIKSLMIPASVRTIDDDAFAHCYNLKAVVIEGGKEICRTAFYKCKNLSSVTMKSVGSIGSGAFYGCTSLSFITIYAQSIGTGAFDNCTSLTAVVIGKNVRSIYNNCFKECPLISVRFEDTKGWCSSDSFSIIDVDVTDATKNASELRSTNKSWWKR